ncbi:profilin, required for normal timing of actin polymerization in response to thermal stress [Linnemannia gamsii]|uniref:Profilin n=1 Tax=Linnemannia gamsii TaxID=64522 RepID=A0ABQ7K3P6_9FUNG|nr:profilin, required for normal timing of actin polymerization in response to thermal stress [Linnemannia gamsii]
MSWKAYVDDNLVGTGKVAKAAIFGLDGSLWATSSDFKINEVEAKKLIAAFNDVSDIAAKGLYLEETKFVFLRNPDNSIYARHHVPPFIDKDDDDDDDGDGGSSKDRYRRVKRMVEWGHLGATGITAVKTGQAVLVGFYNENQQAGACNTVVEGLATYLIGVGY